MSMVLLGLYGFFFSAKDAPNKDPVTPWVWSNLGASVHESLTLPLSFAVYFSFYSLPNDRIWTCLN